MRSWPLLWSISEDLVYPPPLCHRHTLQPSSMSPISHPVHAAARADITPLSTSTLQMDSSLPPTIASPVALSEASSGPLKQGITSGTKIGLGIIPVVVFLCAMWIFSLFWWRKRRARKAIRNMGSPPVPEKDPSSFGGSMDSSRRGSKVLQMSAFSTPIHDGQCREAQAVGESGLRDQTGITNQRGKHHTNATVARLTNPGVSGAEMDSPIDGTSPFRLKRGDTVKRGSLGTEISSLWPSPPPSAWVRKQPSFTDRVVSPPPHWGSLPSRP